MGHYGEVFEAVASEAYVPRMVDQEYMPEDDPGSFLEPGWEEEALGAEAFQEPPESPANHAIDNSYLVPLISQERAAANHESQVNQVTAPGDSSGTAVPVTPGEARWGLLGGARSKAPPRVIRSKALPRGRPSVEEAPVSPPTAEDPWSPRAPLASPLPSLGHPGFRSSQRW